MKACAVIFTSAVALFANHAHAKLEMAKVQEADPVEASFFPSSSVILRPGGPNDALIQMTEAQSRIAEVYGEPTAASKATPADTAN
jgi:hypothetical protein